MFTGAANGFGAEPNTQVDEQVLGLPGVLPVMNKRAVEYAIMVGLALGCKIARHTKWDRKSYYYPDLPKNYQISQYDLPLCYQGEFELVRKDGSTLKIRIRRAHLEEDAGKLLHEAPGGYAIDFSIVDLNRAGTPLLEIVTEPDLSSPQDVALFGQELAEDRAIPRRQPGPDADGAHALRAEHQRAYHRRERPGPQDGHHRDQESQQLQRAGAGDGVRGSAANPPMGGDRLAGPQEHLWLGRGERHRRSCSAKRKRRTIIAISPIRIWFRWKWTMRGWPNSRSRSANLPAARRKRYVEALGLSPTDAAILAADRVTGEFYEAAVAAGGDAQRVSNLILSHGRRLANEKSVALSGIGISPVRFAEIAKLIDHNKISASSAGAIFDKLREKDAPAEQLAAELGLMQVSDTGAIDAAIDAVIAANPKPLQDYRAGKPTAMGALVGMVMKNGKGLNPKMVQEALKRKLQ